MNYSKAQTSVNIRLTGIDKEYYKNQLIIFGENINRYLQRTGIDKIKRVEFGKQDSRGAISITLVSLRGTVPMQKHFNSKDELLGYVVGYNQAFKNVKTKWSKYL